MPIDKNTEESQGELGWCPLPPLIDRPVDK